MKQHTQALEPSNKAEKGDLEDTFINNSDYENYSVKLEHLDALPDSDASMTDDNSTFVDANEGGGGELMDTIHEEEIQKSGEWNIEEPKVINGAHATESQVNRDGDPGATHNDDHNENDSMAANNDDIDQDTNVSKLEDEEVTLAELEDLKVAPPQEPLMEAAGKSRPNSSHKLELRKAMKEKDEMKPRLVIRKLVLTNFKSYAGVQEIGPFHPSFSAVVGPNGSGKSNVIDSMLFVFGFRALKMRQGKLLELIHSSESGQKLDFCQVDIHFCHVLDDPVDPMAATDIPGSEIIISRRATRNNASQYYLNGRSSNYTDVTQYLRDQGIDLDHKRFLILQGEVESISQMKAKAEKENDDGLLEYLEDIIGTTKYKSLINDGLTRLDELNEVCSEKEHRFELVENDTNVLEEKKNDALQFLEKEKQLANKKSVKFQVTIHENQRSLSSYEKTAAEVSEQLSEEKNKNMELNIEVDEAHKKKKTLQKGISKLNDEINRANKSHKSLNNKNVSLEERVKNLETKAKKIEKTKQASERSLSSSSHQLQALKESEEQAAKEMAELKESLEKESEKLMKLREKLADKTSHFSKEIQELEAQLLPVNDEVKEKENAILLIKSELDMLEEQTKKTDRQLQQASQRLQDIKREGKEKEAELDALEQKLEHIKEQVLLGEEQCQNARKLLDKKKNRLNSARQQTQDAFNAVSNSQNKNKVLTSLSKLARSGRISGFFGRLGDLGQIDDKYDIAISTACPGLDAMVVDTVETAQACIDYLRKNKLGYANFVCLNKLRKFDLSPIQTPGNPMSVKRLFDLIIPKEERFLPAFYSKLYNTLVASNLQEAKSVAYGPKRYKVVTLDGKVVDTSGAMSGGGSHFARGAMRLTSNARTDKAENTEEDVAKMKEELATMEEDVSHLQRECEEMEENLQKLKDLAPETEFSIKRVQLDIQSLISEKKEVSGNCKKLLAQKESEDGSSELEGQIKEKQKELIELTQQSEKLKQLMVESETKISALQTKIMDVGGVELKIQDSKVSSLKEKIELNEAKSSQNAISLRKLEHDAKRHTKIVSESEQELQSVGVEIEKVKEDLQSSIKELKLKEEEIDNLSEKKNEHESELEKVAEEVEELNAKINEFKSVEIELENKLEKLNGVVRKCQSAIEVASREIRNLVVRDCTSYIDWMPEDERSKYESSEIETLTEEAIEDVNIANIEEEIEALEHYMSDVKVDIEVLKEYGEKKKELEIRRTELNETVKQRDDIKCHCEELKRKRLDEFMEGFNTISLSLKEMYQMITMGGNAELDLVDSLDPFSEGIMFSVMPPKKSWRNISNLSGGEKTLSSLALVFALHKYKPTPLYVMDEIDAALDFRNVSIVANYIKDRTKNAQFVVISLRNNMFELAQLLVGIYKVENRTRSITLQNKDFLNERTVKT